LYKYNYLIADLLFRVESESAFAPARYEQFLTENADDLPTISLNSTIDAKLNQEPRIAADAHMILFKKNGSHYDTYFRDQNGAVAHFLRSNIDDMQYCSFSPFAQQFPLRAASERLSSERPYCGTAALFSIQPASIIRETALYFQRLPVSAKAPMQIYGASENMRLY
jgi:hypothetical protein